VGASNAPQRIETPANFIDTTLFAQSDARKSTYAMAQKVAAAISSRTRPETGSDGGVDPDENDAVENRDDSANGQSSSSRVAEDVR